MPHTPDTLAAPPAPSHAGTGGSLDDMCEKPGPEIRLASAGPRERESIYRIRHAVYASELGQHAENGEARLTDRLDEFNGYITATLDGEVAAFVSITPPGRTYSVEKYMPRAELPFPVDDRLYEVRLLTVAKAHRGRELAPLLMYAAFRWVESRGGTRIMAIGRHEIIDLYLKAGLKPIGRSVRSGKVTYDILHEEVATLARRLSRYAAMADRIKARVQWELPFAFAKPASCFHGGAFFKSVGERFDTLEKSDSIINADVLDAWFPPSPKVVETLRERTEWLVRTSPPTACDGLIQVIAETRKVPPDCILPGAGSSDLIFLAFGRWLGPESKTLLLDPTYGEYAHVLERVIGCRTDRLTLDPGNDYAVDPDALSARLSEGYDLVVLVNPNSPTGRHVPREAMERILREAPARTKIWVDETYVEYAGAGRSLEPYAARSENVIVCKSMSKVYALSGVRAAYLCASPHLLEDLRAITPPWAVSLPGQVAAIRALGDPDYYTARYEETHLLRANLAEGLVGLGCRVIPGVANFLLFHLPDAAPPAMKVVEACREQNLFLRDASPMGTRVGDRLIRIAVKDAPTNRRMLEILRDCLAALMFSPERGHLVRPA